MDSYWYYVIIITKRFSKVLDHHEPLEELQYALVNILQSLHWRDKHHSCKRYSLIWCFNGGCGESSLTHLPVISCSCAER